MELNWFANTKEFADNLDSDFKIEAARRAMTRAVKRQGKIWIRVFPDKPITEEAAGSAYGMGVREQIIFPEIDYDKVDRVRGLDITITTTAKSDDAEGRALLAAFDFPFRKVSDSTEIVLKGADKQLIGQVAADLRAYRRPEPYKGKGVRYADEVVRTKEAKKNPVERIAYNTVEAARVEHRTDLDKLVIEMETNGTIDPEEAIRRAATILAGTT
ncbi:unnamed protein product [Ranitomeya imitator]|uniref:39S ribosomal protein L16, mitochondrial n=1 Tax=Ranitomeya imitator TaxID=111125 RepID=A0ABN9M8E7_9NEOB|nr:unnamed protein product [Ranitomeya imitator]